MFVQPPINIVIIVPVVCALGTSRLHPSGLCQSSHALFLVLLPQSLKYLLTLFYLLKFLLSQHVFKIIRAENHAVLYIGFYIRTHMYLESTF